MFSYPHLSLLRAKCNKKKVGRTNNTTFFSVDDIVEHTKAWSQDLFSEHITSYFSCLQLHLLFALKEFLAIRKGHSGKSPECPFK